MKKPGMTLEDLRTAHRVLRQLIAGEGDMLRADLPAVHAAALTVAEEIVSREEKENARS